MVAMLELIATRSSGPCCSWVRPALNSGEPPGLAGGDLSVVLRPLSEAQSERLVAELLGDSDACRRS
jgi:hypothetical protein